MLGLSSNLIRSAYRRGLAYVRDGLKLYMPYRGANHSEVKFVGTGSTYFTTNDYVDCGSDSSLDTGSSAFSVCAWFYATNGAESQTIVSKGASQSSASGDVGWALSITANEAVFFDMNEDSSTTRDATSTAHNAFNINQWHHVAIVRPAGATAGRKIYVDGVDVTIEQYHIFPYQIEPYKRGEFVKQPWFEAMPDEIFEVLKKNLGWHLLITAKLL